MKEDWQPKINGKYYIVVNSHVGAGVFKRVFENTALDAAYKKSGNFFKSKREAEFMRKMFGKAW